mmetsp:Transcript_16438/g.38883  ORF Transcript_16438/g.38883 Transcript_16438/m.38883 type:complete len:232 (+) Transcript_16438:1438-2133(+)
MQALVRLHAGVGVVDQPLDGLLLGSLEQLVRLRSGGRSLAERSAEIRFRAHPAERLPGRVHHAVNPCRAGALVGLLDLAQLVDDDGTKAVDIRLVRRRHAPQVLVNRQSLVQQVDALHSRRLRRLQQAGHVRAHARAHNSRLLAGDVAAGLQVAALPHEHLSLSRAQHRQARLVVDPGADLRLLTVQQLKHLVDRLRYGNRVLASRAAAEVRASCIQHWAVELVEVGNTGA